MNRAASAEPPVSIILPTLDEWDCIVDCLSSVLTQDYPTIDEVLVVDGGSSDGTPELARGLDDRVRVVGNPRTTAAAAMNIGLAEARNDLVVRLDAHTIYAPDYVRRSVATLTESGAAIAGGPMRPVGRTSFGRAVAAVTTSPIGIGNGRFHYATEACDVETVYLGTFDRRTIAAAGGYDEDGIQWAAEDQELAFRVRQQGGRIRLDPSIRSWYTPRETPKALWKQYRNYGVCKASTLRKHGRLPYLRPARPGRHGRGRRRHDGLRDRSPGGPWSPPPPWSAYAAAAAAAGLHLGQDPGVAPHRAAAALAICHWGHGVGFLSGLARIATGRGFDRRPQGRPSCPCLTASAWTSTRPRASTSAAAPSRSPLSSSRPGPSTRPGAEPRAVPGS